MKKTLLFLAFAGSSFCVFAQSDMEDILADKNIDWAAEYIQQFRLSIDECQSEAVTYSWNKVTEVKFVSPDVKLEYYNSYSCVWIAKKMMEDIQSGAVAAYDGPELTRKLSNDELMLKISRIDTVITFDPETYEERMQIIRNAMTYDDIKGIQTRMIYYHNKKNNTFSTRLLAYAPVLLVNTSDAQGEKKEYLTPWWVKAPAHDKTELGKRLQSDDVVWAIQTRSDNNVITFEHQASAPFGNNQVKVLKKQKDLRDIVMEEVKTPSRQQYDWEMNPLLAQDVAQLLNAVDTVITFDPETYQQQMEVTQTNIESQLQSVRFVFIWYYDIRRKNLFCRPTFWAPNLHVFDTEGQFRYSKVFFYQKTE